MASIEDVGVFLFCNLLNIRLMIVMHFGPPLCHSFELHPGSFKHPFGFIFDTCFIKRSLSASRIYKAAADHRKRLTFLRLLHYTVFQGATTPLNDDIMKLATSPFKERTPR